LLFSTIARVFLAGNTSSFLSLLAFGTSIPLVLGTLFIKIVPLTPETPTRRLIDPESNEEEAEPLIVGSADAPQQKEEPNIHGAKLAKNLDFWLIFTIMSLRKFLL